MELIEDSREYRKGQGKQRKECLESCFSVCIMTFIRQNPREINKFSAPTPKSR